MRSRIAIPFCQAQLSTEFMVPAENNSDYSIWSLYVGGQSVELAS